MDTLQFLQALYGDIGGSAIHYLSVVHIADRDDDNPSQRRRIVKTAWYNPRTELRKAADDIDPNVNCYFGIGLRKNKKGKRRGEEVDISYIPALWLDVDVGNRRSRKNYFETTRQALNLIEYELPFKPSIIVASGYGLHAYWLLDEPFVVSHNKNHLSSVSEIKEAVIGWNKFANKRANSMGHEIDIVTLAGIMRLPESFNHRKSSEVKQVKVLKYNDDARVAISDVEEYIFDLKKDVNPVTVPQSNCKLSTIEIPERKLLVLRKNNQKFADTWDMKRKLKDDTPSGYCMALAYYMVEAEWEDQEVVSTLAYWRKDNGARNKSENWYRATLKRAKENVKEYREIRKVGDATPEDAFKKLSSLIGKEVESVLKFVPQSQASVSEDSAYEIRLRGYKGIYIKSVRDLLDPSYWQMLIASRFDHIIPTISRSNWLKLMKALLANASTIETASEMSEFSIIYDALADYVSGMGIVNNVCEFREARNVLLSDSDKLWFSVNRFKEWLRMNGVNIANSKLAIMLMQCGSEKNKMRPFIGTNRTSVTVWSIPDGVYDVNQANGGDDND